MLCFLFQAADGIRDRTVTGVQTCALPICVRLGGLVPVGMQRTRRRMVAPLEVLPVDREPPRQAERSEERRVGRGGGLRGRGRGERTREWKEEQRACESRYTRRTASAAA